MIYKEKDYTFLLEEMQEQIAELLANGFTVEIDRSRSGLKLYSFRRKHQQIRKKIVSTPKGGGF